MNARFSIFAILATALMVSSLSLLPAPACCPAPPSGKPVVNADQTVIIIWDAARKMQHFIRKASFRSDADDFGFIVPTPAQPELAESGNDAFPYLLKLTEPAIKRVPRPSRGLGCSCYKSTEPAIEPGAVKVLEEKEVAGFKAVVLEASAADALVAWLKDNGYAFSPEIEAWAKPYVDSGWKFTALKVAKDAEGKQKPNVSAAALRLSFQTDRPLFPYREPDPKSYSQELGVYNRLLRIYFLADARYQGDMAEAAWTGKVAWANKLSPEARTKTLELLNLPAATGPAECWLTEFEDHWPYRAAPADVYFSRAADQSTVEREPIVQYVSKPLPDDAMVYIIAVAVVVPPFWRRLRKGA